MRCGVYVRVSTDDQRDNGYSIDSQLRMIKEYCEKNNYVDLGQVFRHIFLRIYIYFSSFACELL